MVKVLITGGLGYLGSVLTNHLLEENNGYEVACLDNLFYGQKVHNKCEKNKDFRFIYGDVRDKKLIERVIPEYEVIFPLAAIVGMPACDKKPTVAMETNLDAIIHIDKIRSKNQKIIYPNTNSGYGSKTGDFHCNEETPLEPISLYGELKCKAETYLLESEKDAVTLRLATVFGVSPRMRTDLLVNDFVLEALTEKKLVLYEKDFMRNYIHIKDVARSFEHCIRNFDSMKNKPYNLGLDEANMSKEGLALKIKRHIPDLVIEEGKGKDPDKRNYIVSNERILKTGFKPIYSIDYGIDELIKKYKILLKKHTKEDLLKIPYRNL